MSVMQAKIAAFKGPKEVIELLRLRDLPNYQRIAAALSDKSDLEILTIHEVFKSLLKDGALPDEYQMMVEAINMAILPRISNLT